MNFLFFIKPSVICVDCFTSNLMVYNMSKIEPAINFIPKWWKELPSSYGEHPYIRKGTMKRCNGFLDLYKSGFILPMWCDLAVDIGPIGTDYYRYQYSDNESSAGEHDPIQKGKFCDLKNYQHLKLNSPWYLNCKKNINWVFTDVVWNDSTLPEYRVLNGVVNYKFNSSTNVNIIFPREKTEKQLLIPYKTPLAQLIPMTEQKVKLNYHLVDSKILEQKAASRNFGIKFLSKSVAYKAEIQCPIKHS